MSINDTIKKAGTVQEIEAALEVGKTYKYASKATKRKWVKTASAQRETIK